MQTCETCHMQVSTPGECQFCHAPGALPHWERMGVPSDDLETCNTCHLPGSLERPDDEPFMTHPTFDGSDPESCTDCHSTDWCAACHQLDHPNGWMFEHGPIVYDDGAGECVTCHSPSGCSFCHGEGAGFKAPLPADDLSG